MVWLLNSQGMKNSKSIESFCLSILFTQIVEPLLTCLLLPCLFFFCEILNMCRPRTTFYLLWWAGPFGLAFYGSGPACLLSRLLMVNAGWLGFIQSEIFLQIKFIIFQGCSTKQAAFLPGQPVTYNQLLIHHFSLFQNAILHKMLKLGFWNFKPIFLRMQFSLVAAFFSLVLVICLSWYLHLKLSHEFLAFISFNI